MTFNLFSAAIAALAASPVLAARRDPEHVALTGGISSFDEAPALLSMMPQMNLSDLFSRGSDDWKAYKGLPMVGILHDTVSTKVLTVGNSKRRDSRDENSFFACMSRQTERNAVLLHHPAGEGEPAGGVLLELAANRFTGEGVTDGWYLAVHDYYRTDTRYRGAVRVIAHRDPSKAAIWKYEKLDSKTVLRLVGSRDPAGESSIGGYLMVPRRARRDKYSEYLAVSPISNEDGLSVSIFEVATNKRRRLH